MWHCLWQPYDMIAIGSHERLQEWEGIGRHREGPQGDLRKPGRGALPEFAARLTAISLCAQAALKAGMRVVAVPSIVNCAAYDPFKSAERCVFLKSLLDFDPPAQTGTPPCTDVVEGTIPLEHVWRLKGPVVKGFGRGSKVCRRSILKALMCSPVLPCCIATFKLCRLPDPVNAWLACARAVDPAALRALLELRRTVCMAGSNRCPALQTYIAHHSGTWNSDGQFASRLRARGRRRSGHRHLLRLRQRRQQAGRAPHGHERACQRPLQALGPHGHERACRVELATKACMMLLVLAHRLAGTHSSRTRKRRSSRGFSRTLRRCALRHQSGDPLEI